MQRIALFGYGNMGAAFGQALHRSFPGISIMVAEVDRGRADAAVREIDARIIMPDKLSEPNALAALDDFQPEVILLAVKPFQFSQLSVALRAYCRNSIVISLMAGVGLATLEAGLGTTRIVRFLPNLAAAYGKSVTAVTPHASVPAEDLETATAVAESAGTAVLLPEDQISSLIGISGSGIAFAFQFLHALSLAGTQAGISYPRSLEIAISTLEGAAAAVRESGIHPAEYVTRVCSPQGTTIQGIAALEKHGFTASVMHAVHDTVQRSRDMEKEH
ncbi:MAG: pyrroline-5-carboxylate reductase family protein [Spirochaeta sp.]